jgi:hypothetical protein
MIKVGHITLISMTSNTAAMLPPSGKRSFNLEPILDDLNAAQRLFGDYASLATTPHNS